MSESYQGKAQTLAANAAQLSDVVALAADEMRMTNSAEKVPLSDLKRIGEVAEDYLTECSTRGILPTVRGVAARLGVSRQALYDAAARKPGGPLDGWLKDFSDLCGELTMQAALSGTVAAIPAIFTTKARYGWREPSTRIEIGQNSPLGEPTSIDDLISKYSTLYYDEETQE